MAVTESKIPVGSTGKNLDSTTVTTSQGAVEREAVFAADPEDANARAAVKGSAPAADAYGLVARIPEPGTAALTQPAQSATTVTVLAANAIRRGFVIVNDSAADLYLAFAATATTTAFTKKLGPGQEWERRGGYSGVISGIWSAAGGGAARVTEET